MNLEVKISYGYRMTIINNCNEFAYTKVTVPITLKSTGCQVQFCSCDYAGTKKISSNASKILCC